MQGANQGALYLGLVAILGGLIYGSMAWSQVDSFVLSGERVTATIEEVKKVKFPNPHRYKTEPVYENFIVFRHPTASGTDAAGELPAGSRDFSAGDSVELYYLADGVQHQYADISGKLWYAVLIIAGGALLLLWFFLQGRHTGGPQRRSF
jgi:hypothetical protein